ncbi:hypothetical protein MIDIC_480004 [Alphaproteobacteria bacterium]
MNTEANNLDKRDKSDAVEFDASASTFGKEAKSATFTPFFKVEKDIAYTNLGKGFTSAKMRLREEEFQEYSSTVKKLIPAQRGMYKIVFKDVTQLVEASTAADAVSKVSEHKGSIRQIICPYTVERIYDKNELVVAR